VPVPIEPGDAVRADFGDLGEVLVRLDEDGRERTGRIPGGA
jgi:hypothetical protein